MSESVVGSGPGSQEGREPVPWAMQIALRDDRPERPAHLAVCEAVAISVVRLLADPRSRGDGEWAARVAAWEGLAIRKVVRRGRGPRFAAVEALPGVGVEHAGAVVRAFPPLPVDQVPPELGKLQVAGTDVPELGRPAPAGAGVLSVALNPGPVMTTGKAAAQCGHAAQLAWWALGRPPAADPEQPDGPGVSRWARTGFAVRVLLAEPPDWPMLARRAPVSVRDAGHTEVAPGTMTAIAWWPAGLATGVPA